MWFLPTFSRSIAVIGMVGYAGEGGGDNDINGVDHAGDNDGSDDGDNDGSDNGDDYGNDGDNDGVMIV